MKLRKHRKLRSLQKQPSEVFYEESCSWKFRKIHRKTPVPESQTPLDNTSGRLLLSLQYNETLVITR